MCVT
jgi:hypothetical protein